jgi:hypothetical protein
MSMKQWLLRLRAAHFFFARARFFGLGINSTFTSPSEATDTSRVTGM